MPKFKEVVSNIFEEKKEKGGLKLFYAVDIFVSEDEPETPETNIPEPEVPEVPEVPAPAPAVPATTESFYSSLGYYMKEENIDSKKTGIIIVPESDFTNIQTIDDLMDYLVDKKEKDGRPILNEFATELVLTLTSAESATQQASDLLKKNDKILIDLDYGEDKDDSVGIKILKRSGVNSVSVMMKKDGNILPGKFSAENFNNQIIIYRNNYGKR